MFSVKIELICACHYMIQSREITSVCKDEFVVNHRGKYFASRYQRQADYVPRHRYERDCNWGSALSGQSWTTTTGDTFLTQINERRIELPDEHGEDGQAALRRGWRLTCTAYRLLLNTVSCPASSIYGFITLLLTNKSFSTEISIGMIQSFFLWFFNFDQCIFT